MKISNIIIAGSLILFASCNGNKQEEHGHDHSTEHGHTHGEGEIHEHNEQEEFTISDDSVKAEKQSHHTHEDGSTHQSH
jgi:hypothetical protein